MYDMYSFYIGEFCQIEQSSNQLKLGLKLSKTQKLFIQSDLLDQPLTYKDKASRRPVFYERESQDPFIDVDLFRINYCTYFHSPRIFFSMCVAVFRL